MPSTSIIIMNGVYSGVSADDKGTCRLTVNGNLLEVTVLHHIPDWPDNQRLGLESLSGATINPDGEIRVQLVDDRGQNTRAKAIGAIERDSSFILTVQAQRGAHSHSVTFEGKLDT